MATLDRVKTKIQGLINTANTTTGNSDKDLTAAVNALVERANSGTKLPELTEPATQDEVFLNQEYIDENGEKKTGTFTIISEMTEQNELLTEQDAKIAELAEILAGKAAGGGGTADMINFTVLYNNASYPCQAPAGMRFNEWLVSEHNLLEITSISMCFLMTGIQAGAEKWDARYIIMPTAEYFVA